MIVKNRRELQLCVAIALLYGNGVLAQDYPEEIMVTSAGLEETIPMDLSRYGNRVEVITAAQIEQQGFKDIAQALQMLVPGLHIAPKNGVFDYVDASLQGSRSQEILWLIDGVRINNRLYNGTSPLDTIPSHMIERIEVLKGGQGIFYGTQSVGGVVNVVTKSFQDASDGAVGIGINSNDGYSANAYYRTGIGAQQIVLYASKDKAEGYTPYRRADIQPSATDRNRSYDVNVAGIKYALDLTDRSRISLQYQRTENKLDFLTPFANKKTYNEREEDIVTAKYDLQLNEGAGLFLKAYYHNWDTYYTRIHNVVDGSGILTGATRVRDNATFWGYEDFGLNTMLKLNLTDSFETILGVDYQSFSGVDDVWRIANQEEEVTAGFVQLRTTRELFENTALAFGVRKNHASSVADSTVWNASGQHDFTDNFFMRGSAGTSFRLPDAESLFLNELYDDDADGVPDDFFSIGNPNLKPEKSRNLNLGVGVTVDRGSVELTGFRRRITDYIEPYVTVEIAGVEGESFINTDDEVKVEGMELAGAFAMSDAWQINLSTTYTSAKLNGSGPQLVSIPKTEAKFAAQYHQPGSQWGTALALNYVGDVNARRGQTRGNYTVADLSGYFHQGAADQHQWVLRIENLTDKVYATRIDSGTLDVGGSYIYENIGTQRTVHLGYSYHF